MQTGIPTAADLSVILVNYRTAGLLEDCLNSFFRETKSLTTEIIVVDNDSGDDSRERILRAFPMVRWIQMEYNSGFARANNAGIRMASGKNILLLNTDTLIRENAIEKAYSIFETDKEYIACGVQLLNPDGSHQISGAHVMTGGLNTLLPLPYLGRLVRSMGYRAGVRKPSIESVEERQDVDWIIGAFLMVRKEALEKAGLLDEDFFMYSEEMEWCARLKKIGKLCLYGSPQVIHLGGGSSKSFYGSDAWNNEKNLCNKRGAQVIVSNALRIRKEFGLFWLLLINAFYLINIPVFVICLAIDFLIHAGRSRFSFSDLAGYIRNIFSLQTYIPRMIAGRPYFYKVK
jgi:GT2 family glycosyltransferase